MKSLMLGMVLASTLNAAPSRMMAVTGTVHSEDVSNQRSITSTWLPKDPRRIEQFEYHLSRPMKAVFLQYQCHLQDLGDTPWLNEGTPCGTQGEARRLEAFSMRLAGEGAAAYTLRYWCQVEGEQNARGPYSHGEVCGTKGEARKLLGMKVEVVRNK